jgi:hypothetical protein
LPTKIKVPSNLRATPSPVRREREREVLSRGDVSHRAGCQELSEGAAPSLE